MSEERLTRIEEKVDALVTGQESLRVGQESLLTDVESLRVGQESLGTNVESLRAGQESLRTDVKTLRTGQDGLDRRLSKVEVNQEDMSDRIKQIAEGHGATQAAIERAKNAILAHIDRRIDPLELALREHLGTSQS